MTNLSSIPYATTPLGYVLMRLQEGCANYKSACMFAAMASNCIRQCHMRACRTGTEPRQNHGWSAYCWGFHCYVSQCSSRFDDTCAHESDSGIFCTGTRGGCSKEPWPRSGWTTLALCTCCTSWRPRRTPSSLSAASLMQPTWRRHPSSESPWTSRTSCDASMHTKR